jgi:hypothetical protein
MDERTLREIVCGAVTAGFVLSLYLTWQTTQHTAAGLAAFAALIARFGIAFGWPFQRCSAGDRPNEDPQPTQPGIAESTLDSAGLDHGESGVDLAESQDRLTSKIPKIAESCVRLFDELDRNMADFDQGRRQLAEHVKVRIEVILESAGVEAIKGEVAFDRMRHEPDKSTTNGAEIAETISPGFSLGRRVLRRARVRIV